MSDSHPIPDSIDDLQSLLAEEEYVCDRPLGMALYLSLRLGRPLLLEGEAGVGKTEVAKALAAGMHRDLIRMQCYEGLDIHHAAYEWNYARQVLEIQIMRGDGGLDRSAAAEELFRREFLIERPLLRALEHDGLPPVLLIDELDRADEEFEGYLLEFLSEFQLTIPELGTIRAKRPPLVVITSNRTRELHDALKRRCVYCWIDYPDFAKELRIVETKVPGAGRALSEQATAFVQELRQADLYKKAGISETLDWVAALAALNDERVEASRIDETLGILLKNQEDIQTVRGDPVRAMLDRARHRGVRASYSGQAPTTAWATS